MTFSQVSPLLLIWALAVMSPGRDFVAVLRTAASRGRAAGMAAGVGVVCGIAAWAMLAMGGLSALLRATRTRMPLPAPSVPSSSSRMARASSGTPGTPAARRVRPGSLSPTAPAGRLVVVRAWPARRAGGSAATHSFGALFASLLPAGLGPVARAEVLAAMLMLALSWFVALAWAASTGRVATAYERGRRAVDTVMGGLLAAVAVALFPR